MGAAHGAVEYVHLVVGERQLDGVVPEDVLRGALHVRVEPRGRGEARAEDGEDEESEHDGDDEGHALIPF